MTIQEVKLLCKELGIQPSKQLGQNFLIDERICQRIIKESFLSPFNNIYEIGPGLGALTRPLWKAHKELKLIELDSKLANYWQEKGLDLTHQDALKFPWDEKLNEETLVVSNLPYQISSSLVILLSSVKTVKKMIFMFQKEVAQRIKAKEGGKDYGLLSIVAQSYWNVEKLIDVSARAFYPPPKIESRVLVFKRIENVKVHEPDFTNFIKLAFSQRRKLLFNNLKAYTPKGRSMESVFDHLGLDRKVRAEQLSIETFQNLFLELKNGN
ncbi:MAG: ribosomal RNA small subunit methyltransferase A [Bdellovibrionaceae bacterium]|nr:ribosomal RNA small subunit methyltransferase A [Pseudobdellovibrionaceae bacterium]